MIPRKTHDSQDRKFIRCLMIHGKVTLAKQIFNEALNEVSSVICDAVSPGQIINRAIENARPTVVVHRRRVADVEYNVPTIVSNKRTRTIAIRTIIEDARGLSGHGMANRLTQTILPAYRNEYHESE